MPSCRLALASSIVSLLVVACAPRDPSMYGTYPEPPLVIVGPPGGALDPVPGGDSSSYAEAPVDASSDPAAAGYVLGAPSDEEIDTTLEPYGEWIYVEGYGDVWRPYATVVGLDFTPYESCGTWVWTDDYGWTYACDWTWGWLPFHYGRWGWFGDAWAWQPGYDWSPGWVEWRSGEAYCGWRPSAPEPSPYDGNHGSSGIAESGPAIRDHRKHRGQWAIAEGTPPPVQMASHWRFTRQQDFGKRIRPNIVKTPAEGLRVTTIVTRPPMRSTNRGVPTASVMAPRLARGQSSERRTVPMSARDPYRVDDRSPGRSPARSPGPDAIDRLWPRSSPAPRADTATATPTARPRSEPTPTWNAPLQPSSEGTWAPMEPRGNGSWGSPSRGDSSRSGTSSSNGSSGNSGTSWSPPSRSDRNDAPRGGSTSSNNNSSSGSSWSPPSRGGSSGSSWTPPSRGSSGGGGSSWSPPSRGGGSESSGRRR